MTAELRAESVKKPNQPQNNTSKTPNQQTPTNQFHIAVNQGNNCRLGYIAFIQNLLFLE